MILAVDVDYKQTEACVAGVAYNEWGDKNPANVFVTFISGIAEYEPGQFYKREAPCILSLMREHTLAPEFLVIDGYVFLDGREKPGLGKHLYDTLKAECKIIGVAKEKFKNISDEFAIFRANSSKALYITSAGINVKEAKALIESMHGQFRIPTLLKLADQTCRSWTKQQ